AGEQIKLNAETIKVLNLLVLDGLETEEHVVPGEFRHDSVVVGNVYKAPDHRDVDYLVDRLCQWLESLDFYDTDTEMAFVKVAAAAVLAHLYLAWIHPFGDGNGRTARLIEFVLLVRSGLVPAPAAHLL